MTDGKQTLYAVFREGVYRHECGGIFRSRSLAIEGAISHIRRERDGYHYYTVIPFSANEVSFTGESTNCRPKEAAVIAKITQQGRLIIVQDATDRIVRELPIEETKND